MNETMKLNNMENKNKMTTKKNTKKDKIGGLYIQNVLTRKITLPFHLIGRNLKQIIQEKMKQTYEGKCSIEGYIKPDSIRLLEYSSGLLDSDIIQFIVSFECLLCCPVEGMKFKMTIDNITKAGIRGSAGENSPVDVFVARDHNYNNKYFNQVKQGETVQVRVIGQRYEINDPKISIIAELVKPKEKKGKPKIYIKDDE